jgi:hypothetical protein
MCAVCQRRILGGEVGMDCDLSRGETIWLHGRCYGVWQAALTAA